MLSQHLASYDQPGPDSSLTSSHSHLKPHLQPPWLAARCTPSYFPPDVCILSPQLRVNQSSHLNVVASLIQVRYWV